MLKQGFFIFCHVHNPLPHCKVQVNQNFTPLEKKDQVPSTEKPSFLNFLTKKVIFPPDLSINIHLDEAVLTEHPPL